MIQKPIRVLVVDDDEDDVLIIQDALSDLPGRPIRMEWISSFDSAKSAIKARRHDAYLVDYRLGAKTGLDLIAEVRIYSDAPIILLTGLWDRSVDVEADRPAKLSTLQNRNGEGHAAASTKILIRLC